MGKFPNQSPQTSQQADPIDLNNDHPESRHSNSTTVTAPDISSSDLGAHKREKSSVTVVPLSDLEGVKRRKSRKLTGTKGKHQRSNETATGSPPTSLEGDEMRELSQDDVIIAVMGASGSGKSSFINTVANSNVAVGHKLESCTSEISTVRLVFPDLADSDIVFVDTPGFDHTNKTEVEILKMVADWLKRTYEKDILLSGVVYCHRISNTQMAATSLKHLRLFEELCGKNGLQNVILATTMWDEVDEESGTLEEEKMKTRYWNKMLENRSTAGRFMGTRESALQLLQPLIDAANRRSSLLLQHEMVDLGKRLTETSAGRHLFGRAERLVYQRQELIQRIRTEMRRPIEDRSLGPLHDEHQKLGLSLKLIIEEMRGLNLPIGRRFLEMSERWLSQKFSILRLMLTRTIKVQGEVVDRTEGEAGLAEPPSQLLERAV